ncbi:MAG: ABC transporter permease [Lachnospiraceae bacterium]|nr:ABC transporter permease [Lachnospiraceae bacterium]
MKRFFDDVKNYWTYTKYAAKSELKSEVANKHWGWLWWLLDPLLFMIVYSFVAAVVFKKSEQYLAAFIFIGLSCWNFFQNTLKNSVKVVSGNSSIVTKVYIPKYMLVVQEMLINGFKMLISLGFVAIMMVMYRVPLTYRVVYAIPLFLILFVVTFGLSTLALHGGVFIEDLANALNAFLRLLFYFSGVFYSLSKRVPNPYGQILLKCNPVAMIMDGLRSCVLYSSDPDFKWMLIWLCIGLAVSVFGVRTIYKNENTYVKVI